MKELNKLSSQPSTLKKYMQLTKNYSEPVIPDKTLLSLHDCSTDKKGFTYRNFPHRLLLAAAAGISGSPITLSSVTFTAPETAHNPATTPWLALCRPVLRPQFISKTSLFFRNSVWPSASSLSQAALHRRKKQELAKWLSEESLA